MAETGLMRASTIWLIEASRNGLQPIKYVILK